MTPEQKAALEKLGELPPFKRPELSHGTALLVCEAEERDALKARVEEFKSKSGAMPIELVDRSRELLKAGYEAKLAKAVEGLKFYRDSSGQKIDCDGGDKARELLAELEGK